MSVQNRSFERSHTAGEDLSAKQYFIVQLAADGEVEVAEGATDLIVGVLQNKPESGEQAVYRFLGTTKVKAGGAISVGDWVTTDASGEAVATTTDGNIVIGRALEAADDGDVFEVQLGIQHLYIA